MVGRQGAREQPPNSVDKMCYTGEVARDSRNPQCRLVIKYATRAAYIEPGWTDKAVPTPET